MPTARTSAQTRKSARRDPHSDLSVDARCRRRFRSGSHRILRDALLALCGFAFLSAAVGWTAAPSPGVQRADFLTTNVDSADMLRAHSFFFDTANAVKSALPQIQPSAVIQWSDRSLVMVVLAAFFMTIIVFNLAFLRHLGRVYASPRSGRGRRGRRD